MGLSILPFPDELFLRVIGEAKFSFIKVFQLKKEVRLAELKYHHFAISNEIMELAMVISTY